MNKKTLIWLTGVVLFAVILRLVFFSGIGASDDLTYTKGAYEISENKYSFPSTHQGTRLGILYTVSFLYKLFGVNEFSSSIFIFLSSIAGIVLIFYFGKFFLNEKVGLLAAFLLSFFPLDVVFATKLLSDLPSAFFLSLGVLFFLIGEKSKTKLKTNINYLFSGFTIGIAYLMRESALLILVFFIVYALFYKKIRLNYLFILLGFMILFIMESSFFYAKTGDFAFRLNTSGQSYVQAMQDGNYYGRDSFPQLLFHFPYIIFTHNNFGFFYVFIFIALFYLVYFRKKESYPFAIWFATLLIYLSVGTSSFSKYVPFSGTPRYLMIITFPAILLLAYFLLDKEPIIRKVIMPSVVLILFVTSIGFIYLDGSRHPIDNLKSINTYIENQDKPIYTDKRSKVVLEYLSGYKNVINLKEYSIKKEERNKEEVDLNSIRDSYVLVNHKMLKEISEAHPSVEYSFPEEINNPPENWVMIKKVGKGSESTLLYYVP